MAYHQTMGFIFLLACFSQVVITVHGGTTDHRVQACKLDNTANGDFDLRLLSSSTHSWNVKSNNLNATNITMNIWSSSSSCGRNEAVCGCINGTCTYLGSVLGQTVEYIDKNIVLTYGGGNKTVCGASFNGTQAYSRIEFECGSRNGMGSPEFIGRFVDGDKCIFKFKWITYLACPQVHIADAKLSIIQWNENKTHPVFLYDERLNREFNVDELYKTNFTVPGVHNADDSYNYLINLGNYVQFEGTNCDNASVCQTKVDGFHRDIGGYKTDEFYLHTSHLQIVLSSGNSGQRCGKDENKKVLTHFNIICNDTAGVGKPEFSHESKVCDYVFDWESKYGCVSSERLAPSRQTTPKDSNASTPKPSATTDAPAKTTTESPAKYYSERCVIRKSNGSIDHDLRLLSSGSHAWEAKSKDPKVDDVKLNICYTNPSCPQGSAVCGCIDSHCGISLGSLYNETLEVVCEKVILSYDGGDKNYACHPQYTGKFSRSEIHFVCGRTIGTPVYVSRNITQNECLYLFEWRTNRVCRAKYLTSDELTVNQSQDKRQTLLFDKRINASFDLTDLFSEEFNISGLNHYAGNYYYLVNIGGRVSQPGVQCVNASVCQVSTTSTFHRDIGGFETEKFYLNNGELQIILTSSNRRQLRCGKDPNKTVTAIITIQCESSAGLGAPEFSYESRHCDYNFRWATNRTCVRPTNPEVPSTISVPNEPSEHQLEPSDSGTTQELAIDELHNNPNYLSNDQVAFISNVGTASPYNATTMAFSDYNYSGIDNANYEEKMYSDPNTQLTFALYDNRDIDILK